MRDGQLSKVTIVAYANKELTQKRPDPNGLFVLPINPETYNRSFKMEQEKTSGQGNQGNDPKYIRTVPEELKLDFFFDGTGTVEGYFNNKDLENAPVSAQIERFLNVVYYMGGEEHRPPYLKLNWGEFVFPCVLTNLDINYTLFHANGEPLRAKLSASFLNYIEQEKRVAKEDKRSPDLTHVKRIQEDSLPLMTYEIYGDTKYYLHIAKANDLTSFRNIKPSSELVFPPLNKNA
ncbi:MAG: hypothetical protein AAFO69_19370 [Bacteroidota bacterium]